MVEKLFEASRGDQQLMTCLPALLVSACTESSAELVELIIRFAGESIQDTDYLTAFRTACHFGRKNIIRSLTRLCRQHLDFKCDVDYDTELTYCSSDIIRLLNSIYGTSLDPRASKKRSVMDRNCNNHVIAYNDYVKLCYERSSFVYELRLY